ncbi:uncharacterized protein LOC110844159 [Folsomia candida]|uniref:uncharacterized protein LOC110844159 n=1 Tax=Folsomia candida TaxID=158441 RepID=UPI000B900056|nr:uncharacterized protein LOC110844159 [Folsomia candida]
MFKATSKYLTTMKVTSSLFILLAYLTCCIWAWPAVSPSVYRRTSNVNSNYIPFTSNVAYEPADYQQLPQEGYNYNSQWDRAKEPLTYYDLLDDYWMNQPSSGADVEALPNLAELYDPPIWGQIVKEKPESELEELKAEERDREAEERQRAALEAAAAPYQYYAYDYNGHPEKRGGSKSQTHAAISHPSAPTTEKSIVTTTATSTSRKPQETTSTSAPKMVKLLHQQPGQKEVPLLRPPNKAKAIKMGQQHTGDNDDEEAHETEEPLIAVAQRSPVEKPSAYDTLRKYISLEDALKKEAEKRRATSRLQKRAPAGTNQIVTDVESLSGQLTNVKKSLI